MYEAGWCGDAAKIVRLQLRPLQKMIIQSAYDSITLLLHLFTLEQKYFPYALRRCLGFKYTSTFLLKILQPFKACKLPVSCAYNLLRKIFLKFCKELILVCYANNLIFSTPYKHFPCSYEHFLHLLFFQQEL